MTTPPIEPAPSTAAQLIDALLAGGEPVDEGSFSLDTAAAASKLDAYQYADRSTYLIPIAEAAAGLDAQRVSVTAHGEDLLITIEGVTLREPAKFLTAPFTQLSGADLDRTGRALGRLGVGLHMALGDASIDRIAVSHGSPSGMLVAEYRRGAAPRLARREPEGRDQLRIFIDRPWTEAIARLGMKDRELEHLRAAVRHSSHAFELDGHVISGHPRRWDYLDGGSEPGFRYETGLEQVGENASAIELWSEGICVETLLIPGFGFRAVVWLETFRRDLSQLTIVRDTTVNAALAAVEEARNKALATLAQHDATWATSQRPSHWPKARVDRVLGRPVREPSPKGITEPGLKFFGFIVGAVAYLCGIFGISYAVEVIASARELIFLAFMLIPAVLGARLVAHSVTRLQRTGNITQAVLIAVALVLAAALGLGSRL
jgi:hypothetical protein